MFNKPGVVHIANSTTDIMSETFEDICRQIVDPMFEGQRTAGIDGNHSKPPKESGHYYGRSDDYGFTGRHVITREPIEIPPDKKKLIEMKAQRHLDSMWGQNEFLVILEATHFHFQRRKGSV